MRTALKIFIIILIVLASSLLVAATTYVDSSGIVEFGDPNGLVEDDDQTPFSIILYVDNAGDDSNACTANGVNACATIQGAITKIPHVIRKSYTIIMQSAQTHAGFILANRHFGNSGGTSGWGKLEIKGSSTVNCDISGSSGTITSGDDYSLTDTTKSWSVNGARGCSVANGGMIFLVASNTSDTLTFANKNVNGFDAAEAYSVSTPRAIISAAPAGLYTRVLFLNLSGEASEAGYHTEFRDVKVEGATAGYPVIVVNDVTHIKFNRIGIATSIAKGSWSLVAKDVGTLELETVYSHQADYGGFYLEDIDHITSVGGFVSNDVGSSSTDASITFKNCKSVEDVGIAAYTTGTGNCVDFLGMQKIALQRLIASDCAGDGMYIDTGTLFVRAGYADSGVFTGTGNGGYGVSVLPFSNFVFGNGTSITGTYGDATMDNGFTVLVWGTAFASDGDIVVNSSAFCRIERRD